MFKKTKETGLVKDIDNGAYAYTPSEKNPIEVDTITKIEQLENSMHRMNESLNALTKMIYENIKK